MLFLLIAAHNFGFVGIGLILERMYVRIVLIKVSDNVITRVHKITCTILNVRKQAQVMRHKHLSILWEIKNFKSSKNKIYHKCSLFLLSEGRVYNPDVSRHIAENNLAENWTLS